MYDGQWWEFKDKSRDGNCFKQINIFSQESPNKPTGRENTLQENFLTCTKVFHCHLCNTDTK